MSAPKKPFGHVVYRYTRAQAISDGALVDLTVIPEIAEMWKYPIACTPSAWAFILSTGLTPVIFVSAIKTVYKEMTKKQKSGTSCSLLYTFTIGTQSHELKLWVGPGDKGEPVVTLMLSHEE